MQTFVTACSLLAVLLEIFLVALAKRRCRRLLADPPSALVASYDGTSRAIAAAGGTVLFCLPLLLLGTLEEGDPASDMAIMAGYYLMVLYFTLVLLNTRVILTADAIVVSGWLGGIRTIEGSAFQGARESRVTVGMRGVRFSAGRERVVLDEKMENASQVVAELRRRAGVCS